ncbi:hypothetical protein, conserved [Plasmodium vivax]|nr:hypothetical protein, conserved [Plasmodium vivax]
MPCSKPFKYPSYECYKEIKKQFVERIKEHNYDISSYIKEYEPKYEKDKLKKLEELPEIFINLKKYLSNGHVLFLPSTYNGEIICNYISYLLCKQIRGKYGDCAQQTFNNFKDFVYSYNKSTDSNICRNKINRLDFDEIRKREALYDLYDMYNELDLQKVTQNPQNRCSIFEPLIFYYNRFNKSFYEEDEELLDKLTKLKALIEQHKWVSDYNCHVTISNLQTLKSDFLEKKKQLEIKSSQSTLTHLPNQPSNDRLEREGKTISTPAEGQPRTLDVGEEQIEARGHEPKVTELELRVAPLTRREGAQKAAVGPTGMSREEKTSPERTNYQNSYDRDVLEYTNPVDEYETDLVRQYRNPTEYPPITPDDQGVLVLMRNTLSKIVQNVDPVPVVGVSGGMGALFLLFRYTPVGTFFRGRRGRTYGIPSGFNGPFPGEFPGYQDYLGGNIGYSQMSHLAE